MTSSVIDRKKLDQWNNPHRAAICEALSTIKWRSLIEVGCGYGANIVALVKVFKGKQLGGIDEDYDAIKSNELTFNGGVFKQNDGCDIMMSDKAADVLLTDMYLSTKPNIKKYLKEFRRICRKYVVLCEVSGRPLRTFVKYGVYSHNYKALLEKLGFYNIVVFKMGVEQWDKEPQRSGSRIFIARVPNRY